MNVSIALWHGFTGYGKKIITKLERSLYKTSFMRAWKELRKIYQIIDLESILVLENTLCLFPDKKLEPCPIYSIPIIPNRHPTPSPMPPCLRTTLGGIWTSGGSMETVFPTYRHFQRALENRIRIPKPPSTTPSPMPPCLRTSFVGMWTSGDT